MTSPLTDWIVGHGLRGALESPGNGAQILSMRPRHTAGAAPSPVRRRPGHGANAPCRDAVRNSGAISSAPGATAGLRTDHSVVSLRRSGTFMSHPLPYGSRRQSTENEGPLVHFEYDLAGDRERRAGLSVPPVFERDAQALQGLTVAPRRGHARHSTAPRILARNSSSPMVAIPCSSFNQVWFRASRIPSGTGWNAVRGSSGSALFGGFPGPAPSGRNVDA